MRGTGISQADRLYAAALVTAEATVRALLSGSPDQVSLVAMGDNRSKQAKRWCERDSEPPQLADIARSVLKSDHAPWSEQFHALLWLNNATRLSGMEWLWSPKRA